MPDNAGHPETSPRFLRIRDVALELDTSETQVFALLRSGELAGIKIGGRGVWRVERSKFEEWIAERYRQAQKNLVDLPESLDDDPG